MKSVITIGRQYGSGGREIGRLLAEKYDIPFYDNELLKVASEHSGIAEEFFIENDEKPVNSLLYMLSTTYSQDTLPFNHQLFLAQFEAIRRIAKEGPCVIVGRCADYALKDKKNVVNVFVHASMDARLDRAIKVYNIPAKKAEEYILRKDKQRAAYYNFYACRKWGAVDNYHLTIDSSYIPYEECAEMIAKLVELRESCGC